MKTQLSQNPPAKLSLPLTFIGLVDKVEEALSLALELGVAVLVGVVEHAQPAVRRLQLLLGGLWKPPTVSKDSQGHCQKATLKISPEREVCQLLRCINLDQNQERVVGSLHKLIKYSIITPGFSTLSVVQQGTSSVHNQV